jgi:hypothetical protein
MLGRMVLTRPAVLLALLAACGARTGLSVEAPAVPPVDEVSFDVPAPDACVPLRYSLPGRPARVVLLLDRSASMLDFFPTTSGQRTRFQGLLATLRGTFARYDGAFEVGALLFPNAGECAVRAPLDLALGQASAVRVAALYEQRGTELGTPTHEAVRLAAQALSAGPADVPRAILLATDGGPVCNDALDGGDCLCTTNAVTSRGPCDVRFCLDDTRTLATIAAAREAGVPTYVIGLDDPSDEVLRDTLDRMATAGGRRRDGALGYYSARSMTELDAAFESVRRTLARCTRVLPVRPRDPDALRVTVDGREVARDRSRREGWDWSGAARSEVVLYGDACERTTERSDVSAEDPCATP